MSRTADPSPLLPLENAVGQTLLSASSLSASSPRHPWLTVASLIGMAAFWTIRFLLADQTPQWPWADVPIIELKPGDVMVHLAGILAFWVSCPSLPLPVLASRGMGVSPMQHGRDAHATTNPGF